MFIGSSLRIIFPRLHYCVPNMISSDSLFTDCAKVPVHPDKTPLYLTNDDGYTWLTVNK